MELSKIQCLAKGITGDLEVAFAHGLVVAHSHTRKNTDTTMWHATMLASYICSLVCTVGSLRREKFLSARAAAVRHW